MALAGRKSWSEELNIAQRYSDLSEPFFRVLKRNLESGDDAKERWAVEQLSKAFTKMIPQDFTSGGQPLTISFDNALASKFTQ
jgi:hypothetical protein